MKLKKIPLNLAIIGFSLLPTNVNANPLEMTLKDFGACIEQGSKLDQYVVSQFNYLDGKYGYVADNSDCYKQNGDIIRKISNEHFYKRDETGKFNLIFSPNTSKSRVFNPQTFAGEVTSDLGFDILKYFKALDDMPPVPPGFNSQTNSKN